MSRARARTKLRVVVDGSNIATEGRATPSLAQLRDAVSAFSEEYPGSEFIVVVDASFSHRVSAAEKVALKEMELAGDVVSPPAGSVGRGDAFVLKIAERIEGVVLSNDSFQEFQDEHAWLFDSGRLVGGKPVPRVGWIFTERQPVRATRPAPVKKLTVDLPDGKKPTIGATLTPKAKPAAKAPAKAPAKAVAKVAKAAKKAAVKPSKSAAKPVPVTKATKRDRVPVNAEDIFERFCATHKVRSHVEGSVVAFTSHGAVIKVPFDNGFIECYVPTTALGTPPPVRARDVLKRGEQHRFRLTAIDRDRRIPDLALIAS